MADFSDDEDKLLVQLVSAFVLKKTINWNCIERKVKGKTKIKLQGRLKTLKQHY